MPAGSAIDDIRAWYVARSHDSVLRDIVRKRAYGNYLLVGDYGSGKTAALQSLATWLTGRGIEASAILSSLDVVGRGTPDLSKVPVRLLDEFDQLIVSGVEAGLQEILSTRKHINILAVRDKSADDIARLIPIKAVVRIPPVSQDEMKQLLQRLFATAQAKRGDRDIDRVVSLLFDEATELPMTPREATTLYNNLIVRGQRLYLGPPPTKERLSLIAPSLLRIRGSLIEWIEREPTSIWDLSPVEFERLVGEIFERDGFRVTFTKETRDGGIDLFASKRDVGGELLTVVQCKKNAPSNRVSAGVVRQIVGAMNIHQATAAAVFTTSSFTTPAIEEARKIRYRLGLNDYFDIMKRITG